MNTNCICLRVCQVIYMNSNCICLHASQVIYIYVIFVRNCCNSYFSVKDNFIFVKDFILTLSNKIWCREPGLKNRKKIVEDLELSQIVLLVRGREMDELPRERSCQSYQSIIIRSNVVIFYLVQYFLSFP